MNTLIVISGPLFGIIGTLAGTASSEYFRRRRRIEEYSTAIFAKRLESYEKLLSLIRQGEEIAEEVIHNDKFSKEERHQLTSSTVLSIAGHVDENILYIDQELGAHCTALFMGTEDIHDAPESERQQLLKAYYDAKSDAYRMISEDSGVARINELFRSINRPKLSGPIIEAIRELREQQRKMPATPVIDAEKPE
ncbi:MAG TPA: hypothetical protein VN808_04565 [Stellaceae bacterium]|nr:hypothetical protein [Stellaceae bacterium]